MRGAERQSDLPPTYSYTVTRLALQGAGPACPVFQGGSIHRWISALDRDLDVVVTLDDATSADALK
jgi:hypothetical protein